MSGKLITQTTQEIVVIPFEPTPLARSGLTLYVTQSYRLIKRGLNP